MFVQHGYNEMFIQSDYRSSCFLMVYNMTKANRNKIGKEAQNHQEFEKPNLSSPHQQILQGISMY